MSFRRGLCLAVCASALIAAGNAEAAGPKTSDPGERAPGGSGPGTFPVVVTAANINAAPAVGSTTGGAGSDNIHVSFLASGPIKWTESRHNEGDFSLLVGPREPDNTSYYPPNSNFNNYNPLEGGQPFANSTLGWRVNQRTGAALASVRHNGVNNQDWFNGSPTGTIHGIAYFAQTAALGWGYRMSDGVFANGGQGSTDLLMGIAGFDGGLGEAVFNVAAAYFPYEQGWTGAWVNGTPAILPGAPGTFSSSSANLEGQAAATVSWTANVATVTLPGVNSATDGMLFVAPTNDANGTNVAAAFPTAGGWKVAVRDDDEPDNLTFSGINILGGQTNNSFQFLYVPYGSTNLVGGHVQGSTGAMIHEEGGQFFDLVRNSAGQYEVTVYDSDGTTKLNESDGMLIMSVCAPLGGLNLNLADRAFLSYEYSAVEEAFIIESLELTNASQGLPPSENVFGDVLTPTDTSFYFAWVDFELGKTLVPAVNVPGDFDDNQMVNGDDLAIWQASFGVDDDADADNDADTDGNDLLLWQQKMGTAVGGGASVAAGAVPEPGACLLALVATASAAALRRRIHRVRSALAILMVLVGVALTTSARSTSAETPERPNIVVIFIDDLGYADIGPFGATAYKTPNLDRMAAEGRRFTDFHTSSAVCSASRVALLTGCYHERVSILGALRPNSPHGISADELTLAELCKQQGYATAIFGKWHLGDRRRFLPLQHGFDEYYGLPYSNDMWPRGPRGEELPADAGRRKDYPPLRMFEGNEVVDEEVTAEEQTQLTKEYTRRAVSFIDRHREQPFFLYVPHSMVHVPLYVSQEFEGKSGAGLFGDVMMEVDWSVGEILAAIDRNGLDEKTLVIFTSDNGPWLNFGDHAGSAGPLREGKGTMFEGGYRVPCVMRFPGQIPAGGECKELTATIDLLPTVAGRLNVELPAERIIDGRDIWPLMTGEAGAASPHDVFYCYYDNELRAVRDERWKLVLPHQSRTLEGREGGRDGYPVQYAQEQVEQALYDLDADVGETTNVAAEHPEVVARLSAAAEEARADLGDALTGRKGANVRPPGRSKRAEKAL